MTDTRPVLTLYSREHCHLCGVMVAELKPVLARFPVRFQILDVDADPRARELYGSQIPVLLLDGVILSRFRLDAARVESALGQWLA